MTLAGPNKMAVSWVTQGTDSVPSVVLFGTSPDKLDRKAEGESETYEYLRWK